MGALDSISGVLGTSRASHLLRRLTFGVGRKEADFFASLEISEALERLFDFTLAPKPPVDLKTGMPWVVPDSQNSNESELIKFFKCWVYGNMFNSGANAIEKLTFFLHTHFTTISTVVDKSTCLINQYQLLRKYSLGNIKELSVKICTDNAMLILLDNRLNENIKPNENFAREFLELYTIGKGKEVSAGNYTTFTEQDVQSAARILSGWNTDLTYSTIDPVTSLPSGKLKLNSAGLAYRHDPGVKVFSSSFGNKEIKPSELISGYASADAAEQELDEMVEMIFDQTDTAKNICRKLYRFFVFYKITDQIENEIITPMSELLLAENYEIKPVLELLFRSKHFFDEDDANKLNNSKGAIIKSPLELTIGMMRFFNISLPDKQNDYIRFYREVISVLNLMADQGFDLYEPLDVAGYDAYFQSPHYNRNWISPNYLARRYQFAQYIIEGTTLDGEDSSLKLDAVLFVRNSENISDPSDAVALTNEIIKYLLPESISPERFQYFQNFLLDNLSVINWKNEWENYMATGDDISVRMQLNAFINAVLQSAEYQLS